MGPNQQSIHTGSLPKTSIFPPGPAAPALAGIPGVAPTSKPWIVIYAVIGVVIFAVGTFILYFSSVSVKAKIRRTDQAVNSLTRELASEPLAGIEREVKQLTSALSGYKRATSEKVNYAKINDELVKVTPADVTISSFSIDEKGLFRLNGKTGNFVGAGKALLAYRTQSQVFNDVKLENVTFTDDNGVRVINFFIIGSLKKSSLKETKSTNTSPVPSPIVSP